MNHCPLCNRPADAPHPRCVDGLESRLRAIPGLYRLLGAVLEPGVAAGARVSGSRTPPIPVRLEPLNLRARGGIVTILATWETDWRNVRGLADPPARADDETGCEAVVGFLRAHLEWAVSSHPAIAEFAGEIGDITTACKRALGLTTDMRRIGRCPTLLDDRECGRILYADPYANVIRCDRCHTDWPRSRWLILGATLAGATT